MATFRLVIFLKQEPVSRRFEILEGNYSIYEGNFEDESHTIKHNEIGMLGMCKKAGMTHSNESQFYVTLSAPMTFLDERNFVAFGRVI